MMRLPAGSEFKLVGLAGTSVDDVYVEQLLNMGRGLVDKGVGLVGCQKCIHPLLQDFLHQEVGGYWWVWLGRDLLSHPRASLCWSVFLLCYLAQCTSCVEGRSSVPHSFTPSHTPVSGSWQQSSHF